MPLWIAECARNTRFMLKVFRRCIDGWSVIQSVSLACDFIKKLKWSGLVLISHTLEGYIRNYKSNCWDVLFWFSKECSPSSIPSYAQKSARSDCKVPERKSTIWEQLRLPIILLPNLKTDLLRKLQFASAFSSCYSVLWWEVSLRPYVLAQVCPWWTKLVHVRSGKRLLHFEL